MALTFFQQNRLTIPDYEVLEKVGEGGMSTVYKARHEATGRVVAIKIINAELTDDLTLLQRFEQEFRVANKLVHPNIVRMFDFGSDETLVYIVMEYVEGPSLRQRIKQEGRLPEAEAVLLITQAAQALDYAHKHLIIHRDVKPDNILLTEGGHVKLTDFGLVKDILGDRQLTAPLSTLGTAHFMAPEQYLNAKQVDKRCDIYSLGATLYAAVTGQLPYGSCRTLGAVMQQIATGALTPPREHVPALSAEVDEAIRWAMNPEPAERPASCLEFLKRLSRKGRRPSPSADGTGDALAAADTPREGGRKEYRASVRHPYDLGTSCGIETSVHASKAADNDSWPALVQDISQGGFALLLGRRLEPDTIVAVDLQPPDVKSSRVLQARVAHVQPHGCGHWRIGCEFLEPLSPEDIEAML